MENVNITKNEFNAFVKLAKSKLDLQKQEVIKLDDQTTQDLKEAKTGPSTKLDKVINKLFPKWKKLLLKEITVEEFSELVEKAKKQAKQKSS